MLHKYLPRLGAGVLAAGLLAGCGDTTSPRPASRLVLDAALPAGDSVAQLGVELRFALRDSVPMRSIRVYVDSAAGVAPQFARESFDAPPAAWALAAFVPGPGRHTITVAVVDTAGRPAGASLTRVFTMAEVQYVAARLPDLGHGGAALFVHANGATAGWVATDAGRKRPAVWRDGVLAVVPAPDTGDVVATRVNAAGDVLLRFGGPGYVPSGPNVRVRRADGVLLTLGPLRYTWPDTTPLAGQSIITCCSVAADLNDRRQALGTAPVDYVVGWETVLLDVASGRVTDSLGFVPAALNDIGQMLGTRPSFSGGPSSAYAIGFTLPPLPSGPATAMCGALGSRGTPHESAVDLDDAGNALTNYCGNLALRSPAGSVWLDRYVGPLRQARLSRTGGVVAGLDSAGALVRWSLATRRAEQVRVGGSVGRLATIGAVTASGVIAGEGVDGAGRAIALLLTPAPR